MKILFAGGGTSGHINPALAVADALSEKYPGTDIRFFGTPNRLESDLVPRAGYKLYSADMSGLRRDITPDGISHNFKAVGNTLKACGYCKKILKEFCPDVVVGTGGYIAFPAVFAAQKMKIPTILLESNVSPGAVTKMLCRKADRVLVNFKKTKDYLPKNCHVICCGSPVRREMLLSTDRASAKKMLGFDDKPLVVSFWGSLGARGMNEKMIKFIELRQKENLFCHIHAAGSKNFEIMRQRLASCGIQTRDDGFSLREYIYDMPQVMAAADVILCRAGASTIAEICALGRTAVLIPSPNVTENHQEINARELSNNGAAIVITEQQADGQIIYDTVKDLLNDAERRFEIERKASELSRIDSLDCACETIMSVIK